MSDVVIPNLSLSSKRFNTKELRDELAAELGINADDIAISSSEAGVGTTTKIVDGEVVVERVETEPQLVIHLPVDVEGWKVEAVITAHTPQKTDDEQIQVDKEDAEAATVKAAIERLLLADAAFVETLKEAVGIK